MIVSAISCLLLFFFYGYSPLILVFGVAALVAGVVLSGKSGKS
jgi:hypothetical protein